MASVHYLLGAKKRSMTTGTCEKDLIDIGSALAVPIIAFIAVYVAWRQWKLDQRRLRHELFDRNFRVYEAVLGFLGSVISSGKAKDEHLYRFRGETRAAKFLLGEDIHQLLDEIYEKAIDLQTLDAELEGVPVGEERTANVRKQGEIKKWLYRQFEEVDKRFESSLGLREPLSIWKRLTRPFRRCS